MPLRNCLRPLRALGKREPKLSGPAIAHTATRSLVLLEEMPKMFGWFHNPILEYFPFLLLQWGQFQCCCDLLEAKTNTSLEESPVLQFQWMFLKLLFVLLLTLLKTLFQMLLLLLMKMMMTNLLKKLPLLLLLVILNEMEDWNLQE